MGQGRSAVLPLGYWAGIVIKGSFCSPPDSVSVKKNINTESARFERQSLLAIQNQWSLYRTAANASAGLSLPL